MIPEKTTVIRDDDRVTRLFPGRARRSTRAPGDSRFGPHDPIETRADALSSELQGRLGEALEEALRDPLLRIGAMADVLRSDPSERHRDQLTEIREASDRAEAMLADVLDFLRASSGSLGVARRRVDLKLLCERVVDAIHTRHPDRPMLFTSTARVEGSWDPDRVAALLTKLVVNAIDHGPVRPAIRIDLHDSTDSAVLRVWNAGRLLIEGPPARVFEPFVSGPPAAAGGTPRLGLGLYLAREIARAHGGRIELHSHEEHGTTFQVTLPRA
ncbi:MAG: HAMP domain-containing histidine kinase [Myxococcota bacterium]|nr:HAMP domain-containing histidine kinase [Myxococcota bacterium]